LAQAAAAGGGRFRAGVWLWVGAFLLYAATSPGNLPGDTQTRWSVARRLVRGEGFSLESEGVTWNYAVGKDGKPYYLTGLGQIVLLAPLAGLGLALERWGVAGAGTADLAGQFLAAELLFPALGALGVWLAYRVVRRLGYSERAAVGTAAVLGLGTMHWHYAVVAQEASQVAAALLGAAWLMVENRARGRFVYALGACVLLGAALGFRLAEATAALPMFLAAAVSEAAGAGRGQRARAAVKWVAAGLLGVGPALACWGWYDWARFGSVWETGYGAASAQWLGGHGMFESRAAATLAAMLFSPGKSIFLYNPALLPAAAGWVWFWRREGWLAAAVGGAVGANFIFYSFFTAWAGDYAWSIRYQAVVLGLLVLPIAGVLERVGRSGRWVKAGLAGLVAASAAIQGASLVYNFHLEFVQNPNHGLIPDGYVWDWSQSHLRMRFENLGRHAAGRRSFSSAAVAKEDPALMKVRRREAVVREAHEVNFFPFKARAKLGGGRVFYGLLGLWAAAAAGWGAVAYRVGRWYSSGSE